MSCRNAAGTPSASILLAIAVQSTHVCIIIALLQVAAVCPVDSAGSTRAATSCRSAAGRPSASTWLCND
jgi:hypothetical protein